MTKFVRLFVRLLHSAHDAEAEDFLSGDDFMSARDGDTNAWQRAAARAGLKPHCLEAHHGLYVRV